MFAIEDGEDIKAIVSSNCRLVFRRLEDRWTHALILSDATAPDLLAESFESDDSRDDPREITSPVYQEIVLRQDPDTGIPQALLIGQYGSHHFSGVFSVYEKRRDSRHVAYDGQQTFIKVSAADRCRSPLAALAATYSIGPFLAIPSESRALRVLWSLPSRGLQVELAETEPAEKRGGVSLHATGGGDGVLARANALIRPGEATQCLYYRWFVRRSSRDRNPD